VTEEAAIGGFRRRRTPPSSSFFVVVHAVPGSRRGRRPARGWRAILPSVRPVFVAFSTFGLTPPREQADTRRLAGWGENVATRKNEREREGSSFRNDGKRDAGGSRFPAGAKRRSTPTPTRSFEWTSYSRVERVVPARAVSPFFPRNQKPRRVARTSKGGPARRRRCVGTMLLRRRWCRQWRWRWRWRVVEFSEVNQSDAESVSLPGSVRVLSTCENGGWRRRRRIGAARRGKLAGSRQAGGASVMICSWCTSTSIQLFQVEYQQDISNG